MKESLKLTIATVTFNCLEYTKLFLRSLREDADVPYHLIVVDNHSTDGTREFLLRQRGLELVLNQRNLGFGWGNNQAFTRTKTPYFLGLNNDTFIFPGFLGRILALADAHPEYAELGVNSNCIGVRNPSTGRRIDPELGKLPFKKYSPQELLEKYYGNYGEFFESFARKNPGLLKFEVPPNFIGGWCFLARTEAVKKVGGLFDQQFRIGFWEDVDLSWRLARAGYKIGLIKEAYLHHFTHISFAQNKLRLSDRAISRANGLRFAEKWSEEIRNFLNTKFSKGIFLQKIISKYFIFRVFFGRRKDYRELENALKKNFLERPGVNFREFLLMKIKKK